MKKFNEKSRLDSHLYLFRSVDRGGAWGTKEIHESLREGGTQGEGGLKNFSLSLSLFSFHLALIHVSYVLSLVAELYLNLSKGFDSVYFQGRFGDRVDFVGWG